VEEHLTTHSENSHHRYVWWKIIAIELAAGLRCDDTKLPKLPKAMLMLYAMLCFAINFFSKRQAGRPKERKREKA
jgi:hypothetical protein